MTDSCHAMFCQYAQVRGGVADHDVQWERRRFREAGDQRDIRQAGREEPIRTSFRICACSRDRLNDHSIVMRFGRSLKKDICPSIDEEADIGCIGRMPSVSDAIALLDGFTKSSIRRKTILEVAAYRPRVDRQSDGLADHLRPIAISAFQIDR